MCLIQWRRLSLWGAQLAFSGQRASWEPYKQKETHCGCSGAEILFFPSDFKLMTSDTEREGPVTRRISTMTSACWVKLFKTHSEVQRQLVPLQEEKCKHRGTKYFINTAWPSCKTRWEKYKYRASWSLRLQREGGGGFSKTVGTTMTTGCELVGLLIDGCLSTVSVKMRVENNPWLSTLYAVLLLHLLVRTHHQATEEEREVKVRFRKLQTWFKNLPSTTGKGRGDVRERERKEGNVTWLHGEERKTWAQVKEDTRGGLWMRGHRSPSLRLTALCRCTWVWPPSGCSVRSPPSEGATSPRRSAAGPRRPERRCTASARQQQRKRGRSQCCKVKAHYDKYKYCTEQSTVAGTWSIFYLPHHRYYRPLCVCLWLNIV